MTTASIKKLNPHLLTVAIAGFFFGLGLLFFELPFIADDHYYLWRGLAQAPLSPLDSYTFARMPVSTTITTGVINSGILETHPALVVAFFFAIHCLAFSLLYREFLARTKTTLPPLPVFALFSALFSFHPNNYEIHLWHICSIFSVGALALSLAFRARAQWWLSLFLIWIAVLTYDSFFLLLFGAAALWVWANPKPAEVKRFGAWVVLGFGLGLGTKFSLKTMSGALQVIPFELAPLKVIKNISFVLRELYSIHFFKVNWPLSIAHGIVLGALTCQVYRRNIVSPRKLAALIFIPILCALPLALNTYPAPRSYYGPQLVQALVVCVLLTWVWQSDSRARPVYARFATITGSLLALIFLIQWFLVFRLKDENVGRMRVKEDVVLTLMRDCASPCKLTVPDPEDGLKRDYILPPWVWNYYFERLRIKNFPEKKIEFVIKPSS